MSRTTHTTRTADGRVRSVRRAIPWTGVAAGVLGAIATMMSSTPADPSSRASDPAGTVTAAFDGLALTLKASSALGFVAVALLLVFAADLRRRLAAQDPAGGLGPGLAWAGALLAGAALAVAFMFAAMNGLLIAEGYRDTTLEAFSVIADNLAFAAWTPLGLTMAVVAVGAVRHASSPRWVGVLSAATLCVLIGALAVGLPFASWAIVCFWLVVAGVAGIRESTA